MWFHFLFKYLGKAILLNTFYQYATFIGSLHQIQPENKDNGFLAIIQLIGTSYFKKHLAAFISLYNYETPKQLFNSLDPSLDSAAKHVTWLQEIWSVLNNRITNNWRGIGPILYFLVATLVTKLLGYTAVEKFHVFRCFFTPSCSRAQWLDA